MSMDGGQAEIPSLDGWRAVAISLVVLSHAGFGHIVPGGLGVTVFFFLSGFLITTLMLRELSDSGGLRFKQFYLRRFFRLTPPLVIVLSIVYPLTFVGVLGGEATLAGLCAQLFYFANYFYLFFDGSKFIPWGTGIFWSLAVEEHFYLFFPALLVLVLRFGSKRNLLLTLCALCLAVLLWRLFLVSSDGFLTDRTYYATDTRIDSILYGCILATAWRSSSEKNKVDSKSITLIAISIVAILASLFVRDEAFRETFRYSIQGMALISLFKYSVSNPEFILFRPLNWWVVKRVGVYSYSIYLVHYVLLQNLKDHFSSAWVNLCVSLVLAVGFSYLIDIYVDSKFRVLRHRFR